MPYYGGTIKKMLPKTYLCKRVAQEIDVALTHFKNLEPVVDKYVYNDGTTKHLMSLMGTIPVMFQDKTYNIPICLWIEESYPQSAPICYVRPTREMVFLRGKYVSSNGEVMLPYMEEWKNNKCDLASLLQVMVATFGDSPPVCMQLHPEPEHDSCGLQYHREEQVFSKTDGRLYLRLAREDGQLLQQENETNC